MGYVPFRNVVCCENNLNLDKKALARIKLTGETLFEVLPSSENGTNLKVEHFSDLIEQLNNEQVVQLCLAALEQEGDDINNLLAVANRLNVFSKTTDYPQLKPVFFKRLQTLINDDDVSFTTFIKHIGTIENPEILGEFIKYFDDEEIIVALFEGLVTHNSLTNENFLNCELNKLSHLPIDFLNDNCHVLGYLLQNAMLNKNEGAQAHLLNTNVDVAECLPNQLSPLEFACQCGCRISFETIAKRTPQLGRIEIRL